MNRQGVDMRVACTHLHSDDTHKSLHWMMRTSHPNQKPKLQSEIKGCNVRMNLRYGCQDDPRSRNSEPTFILEGAEPSAGSIM